MPLIQVTSELPTILVILELDTYVESQDGRYSSFLKFSTMYVHVTYKCTAGTKIPLFVLKPTVSLENTSKFKKQGSNRLEYIAVYAYVC